MFYFFYKHWSLRWSNHGASAVRFANREFAGKWFSDGDLGETRVRQWWENRGIDYRFSMLLWIVWARALFTHLSLLCVSHVSHSRVIYLACAKLTRRETSRMATIDRRFPLSRSRLSCFLATFYHFFTIKFDIRLMLHRITSLVVSLHNARCITCVCSTLKKLYLYISLLILILQNVKSLSTND